MNDTVKAIETVYKGYRFRSRLEARWAVVFDHLELDWEYEPEGFDLGGDLGYYLPDFYVRNWDAWVEIKPKNTGPRSYSVAVSKLRSVCGYVESRVGLLFVGGPGINQYPDGPDKYSIAIVYYGDDDPYYYADIPPTLPPYELVEGRKCEHELWLRIKDKYEAEDWIGGLCLNPIDHNDGGKLPLLGYRTQNALLAGQQARFEHGETPVPPPSQSESPFYSAQS